MLVPAYRALQLLHGLFLPAIDPSGLVLSHPHIKTNGGHTENHTGDTSHTHTVGTVHTCNANMLTQMYTNAHDAHMYSWCSQVPDLCEFAKLFFSFSAHFDECVIQIPQLD